jgi:serine/threonine protein kinase
MGSNGSKEKIAALEAKHRELMEENMAIAQRLSNQEKENQRQHEEAIEKMGKLIMLLAQQSDGKKSKSERITEIEITGTTYQMLELLGEGGFGKVYKAKVKNTNRVVAIKTLPDMPQLKNELDHEIEFLRLAREIQIENHPVIQYFGSKRLDSNIYIAMELAACDIATFWVSKLSEGDAQEIIIFGMILIVYVLRALVFLEKLNIIHGDIKPQNLVVVPNEKNFCVKLIDFGTVEKMNTQGAQLTVDASKAHTFFFVSPEFAKRNPNNAMSRRLHKKSDAWAAGVMFHLLFCGKLPWQNAHEFDDFCNDSNAKDVVVPDIGGYKMIIELLLKKNPDERSSAKATLLQIKAHPVFKPILDALNENFCPVDDVCYMKVPPHVQQGLRK